MDKRTQEYQTAEAICPHGVKSLLLDCQIFLSPIRSSAFSLISLCVKSLGETLKRSSPNPDMQTSENAEQLIYMCWRQVKIDGSNKQRKRAMVQHLFPADCTIVSCTVRKSHTGLSCGLPASEEDRAGWEEGSVPSLMAFF